MPYSICRCARVCASLAALLLAGAPSGQAQLVYVTRDFNKFGTVDLGSGVYTEIATTAVQLNALTFTPQGALYGIGSNGDLYTVAPTTGLTTDLGNPGSFFSLNSLAARSDSTLFGDDPFGRLFTLNPATALATVVGDAGIFGLHDTGGLAFGAGDTLYSLFGDLLYTRDTQTGIATQVGSGPTGIGSPGGLVFDNAQLYAFNFFGSLYTIDTMTGVGTATGVTVSGGFGPIHGAAAAVPEPSAVALLSSLSLSGAGLLFRRRRRARVS